MFLPDRYFHLFIQLQSDHLNLCPKLCSHLSLTIASFSDTDKAMTLLVINTLLLFLPHLQAFSKCWCFICNVCRGSHFLKAFLKFLGMIILTGKKLKRDMLCKNSPLH